MILTMIKDSGVGDTIYLLTAKNLHVAMLLVYNYSISFDQYNKLMPFDII